MVQKVNFKMGQVKHTRNIFFLFLTVIFHALHVPDYCFNTFIKTFYCKNHV
jgi:hypothetical protein